MYKLWIVAGELASKANSRRYIRPGLIIKSPKALAYCDIFAFQVRPKPEDCILEGEVILTASIFYSSQRPDLDESLLMDCIQKSGLLKNDRQIREKHIYHGIDRERPRVEFELKRRNI